jgi:vancomycin permeability regulator SanA
LTAPTAEREVAVHGAPRRRWVRRLALGVLALVAVYLAYVAVSVVAASRSDQRDATEAIVVLGAAQYDGTPSPVLQQRLDHARALYEEGVAPRIVLTGSKQEADRFTEAYAGFRYLLGEGVPEQDMAVVTDGASTYESLVATARVLREEGIDRVTLVSDGYHNRRLKGIASEVGLDATVSPSTSGGSPPELVREMGLVAAGELIGFRRLERFS